MFLFISKCYSYIPKSIIKICPPTELRTYLKNEINKNYKYLTYPNAKKILHNEIDNIDIYGDGTIEKNVEHIFPQSMYKENPNSSKMRSDLHNLYLCNNLLNNKRQNFKYMDSKDIFDYNDSRILDNKGKEITDRNELLNKYGYLMITDRKKKIFIPSSYSRGKISRSLSYFAIKYDFLNELTNIIDIKTLVEWNLKEPVDDEEYLKNIIVYKFQGNLNPFIIDPDLVQYSFSDMTDITNELLSKKRYSTIDPFYTIDYLVNKIDVLEKSNSKNHLLVNKLERLLKHRKNY